MRVCGSETITTVGPPYPKGPCEYAWQEMNIHKAWGRTARLRWGVPWSRGWGPFSKKKKNSGKLALRTRAHTHTHTHRASSTCTHGILHLGLGIKRDRLLSTKIYSVLLCYICVIKEAGSPSGRAACSAGSGGWISLWFWTLKPNKKGLFYCIMEYSQTWCVQNRKVYNVLNEKRKEAFCYSHVRTLCSEEYGFR